MKLWEFENNRNSANEALFDQMLRIAYPDINLVVAGHHIFFRREGYTASAEIPSADALMFDHFIAKAVWGQDYLKVLSMLAMEPVATRDAVLQQCFKDRRLS